MYSDLQIVFDCDKAGKMNHFTPQTSAFVKSIYLNRTSGLKFPDLFLENPTWGN